MILLEGMAAGTPVVASDLVGYRNVARPDQDALLTRPATPSPWPRALSPGAGGRSAWRSLVASGEQRAASFSLESLAKRYLDLYDEARRRHRGGAPTGAERRPARGRLVRRAPVCLYHESPDGQGPLVKPQSRATLVVAVFAAVPAVVLGVIALLAAGPVVGRGGAGGRRRRPGRLGPLRPGTAGCWPRSGGATPTR